VDLILSLQMLVAYDTCHCLTVYNRKELHSVTDADTTCWCCGDMP